MTNGNKIGVIGGGSWGTALANLLGGRGHNVRIWDPNDALLAEMERAGENKRYLPGVKLSGNVRIARESKEALHDADIVLFAAPAQRFRDALKAALPLMRQGAILVNVAKGIEQNSLKTCSQIAEECAPDYAFAALSGPSHAEEVGMNMPTTVAVASARIETAERVQDAFMTDRFRIYTNSDVLGLELGGSLKNIIALGAGISDGMGFGDNTKAALMTRGMAEMVRLGVRMGAHAETFSGLAGVGDLIVTCTSMHSRNRRCGILIGEGMDPREATAKIGMVVEGMYTAEAAYDLSRKFDAKMPITEHICKVIKGGIDAKEALAALMGRPKRHEREL
ncbi:MAG: NAD(P)H-dependent glycerol-3-phosphate dehydrogenase [Clostridiales Family XIII bacterium]|jgi:glycerol-3-phosphate dehydrogenase (NAD(P)+)|nr:NAD(P)H-dependent glycerol-3-phosphate dehydrogenase [Clostridiales Family XIII bacterium]